MSGGIQSKFVVLADVSKDGTTNLALLKQQIKNIPYGSSSSGHEKAHIKLEKGLKSTVGSN